jgi:ABC-type bacteriocin/lantibiotic exporter with double-glycine peptidase domain
MARGTGGPRTASSGRLCLIGARRGPIGGRGTGEHVARSTVHVPVANPQKKRVTASAAWREARELVWRHRRRLAIGLTLMLVSRLASLVLPASSKWLVDEVVTKGRSELLPTIVLAVLAATLVQAVTSFVLSQILGVAAQRAITEMRKRVQARIMHLPVRYFDSTQTGVLVSRIMSDAEGIRNLVGTGLVQLVGGFVSAFFGLALLIWINWQLTLITILVLAAFGGGMAYAFRTLRPLFRERGKINAEVTGRLTESLGGIRIVKSYTAEKREEIVFAKGAHRLFRNIAKSMTGVSATTAGSTVIVGIIGVLMVWLGGRAILNGEMTLGDLLMYIFLIGLVAAPLVSIASIGTQIASARCSTRRRSSMRTRCARPSAPSRALWRSKRSGSSTPRGSRCCAASRSARRPERPPRSSARAAPARAP